MPEIEQTRHRGLKVSVVTSAGVWIGLVLTLIAGCSGLGGIDSRVDRVIRAHTESLGGGARNPSASARTEVPGTEHGDYVDTPQTRNPDADELRYLPANEARDVGARLRELEEQSRQHNAEPLELTLAETWRVSQRESREYKTAEEEYVLAAIRMLIEHHLWSPRFFNDTSVSLAGVGTDGTFNNAVTVINDLRVTQRLPYGGSVEAGWVTRATQNLRESVTNSYVSSSDLVMRADIPLLQGAGQTAREDLIQSNRNMVYAARTFERFRREFLVSIARDYFSLLTLRAQILNRERRIERLQESEVRTRDLVEAGRQSSFDVRIIESEVLGAQASLANQSETYTLSLDRFKIRLGLDPGKPVDILPLELSLPDPDFTLPDVTKMALAYRLDLQNTRDRIADSRRGVSNARNLILPTLDLTGNVSVPTDPGTNTGGAALDPDFANYAVGVTFGLPLDREIERLRLRQSVINYERRKREYERVRDTVAITARAAARGVELARFQLELAELSVQINRTRLEEQRLKEAQLKAQTLLDTEQVLLDAQNTRDQAQNDLRTAILEFLLETGRMRVEDDGGFGRLPGMDDLQEPGSIQGSDSDAND